MRVTSAGAKEASGREVAHRGTRADGGSLAGAPPGHSLLNESIGTPVSSWEIGPYPVARR